MEMMFKISVLAVLTAVLCVLVRQNEKATGLALSILVCAVVLLLGFRFLQPVWSVIEKLRELSGLSSSLITPLFKVVGIGLLTQVAGSICAEAGEASLSKAVEISGTILSVYASLPLLTAILSLVEKLIGGKI